MSGRGKRKKGGSKALPVVGPRKEPKTLSIDGPKKEPKIGENILDHDLDEGEVHNPMNRVKILTGLNTHRDLAEAQMEGGFAFSGSGYAYKTPSSSKQTGAAPEPLNCAPPQDIRVARFPKTGLNPSPAWKQTVDVKADKHHGDAKLGHVPDFREDWGAGDEWKLHRRAYYAYVAPTDIPEAKLHGLYIVFATYGPGYTRNTHNFVEEHGRHVHKDFFIAKIRPYPDGNRWTAYIDIPEEFFTATTKDGCKVYECYLAETNKTMIAPLQEW